MVWAICILALITIITSIYFVGKYRDQAEILGYERDAARLNEEYKSNVLENVEKSYQDLLILHEDLSDSHGKVIDDFIDRGDKILELSMQLQKLRYYAHSPDGHER